MPPSMESEGRCETRTCFEGGVVRLGVHLPLADLGSGVPTAEDLRDYVVAARELGFSTVAANDHLVWSHPWLDGTTALASVATSAGEMALATSITLPVVRHPAVVAKTLTTLAVLARGPVVGGLGPGPADATTRLSGSRSRSGGRGSTRPCHSCAHWSGENPLRAEGSTRATTT